MTANNATTYTDLLGVSKINPSRSRGEVEDVVLESTWERYLPTIGAGELTFTIRHRPGDDGYKKVMTLLDSGEEVPARVTYPDGSKSEFTAFVKSYSKNFENKSIVDAEVGMRVNTKPEFTEAP